MSESWALNDEDRLYIPNLTPESIVYDLEDRNYGSFYLNSEERIDADAMPDSIQCSSPFPMGVWTLQSDGTLHAGGMPEKIYGQTPYPYGVWYLKSTGVIHAGGMPDQLEWQIPYGHGIWFVDTDENQLTTIDFNELPTLGAFSNAQNMVATVTSDNLQSIGEESYRNTRLRTIEIPQTCTYYPTSFPDDCEVTYKEL